MSFLLITERKTEWQESMAEFKNNFKAEFSYTRQNCLISNFHLYDSIFSITALLTRGRNRTHQVERLAHNNVSHIELKICIQAFQTFPEKNGHLISGDSGFRYEVRWNFQPEKKVRNLGFPEKKLFLLTENKTPWGEISTWYVTKISACSYNIHKVH